MKTARKLLQLRSFCRRCSPLLGFLVVAGPSALDALAQPSGTFILTGKMTTPRIGHTATRLNDGRVLITGGFSPWVGTEFMSAELYDPITGTFALTGNMIHPRESHTATLFADGRVLIVGGHAGISDLATAELYDPSTGTFTETGGMQTARREHAATLLNTGKVLISGGSQDRCCELFDPATGAFTPINDSVGSESWANAAQLYDGKVLTVGGQVAHNASLFDPTTETFRFVAFPGEPVETHHLTYHTATLLQNGKVLIAGGASLDYEEGAVAQAVIYDPASESFQQTGSLLEARAGPTATLLPDVS
jgi:Kelch motif